MKTTLAHKNLKLAEETIAKYEELLTQAIKKGLDRDLSRQPRWLDIEFEFNEAYKKFHGTHRKTP